MSGSSTPGSWLLVVEYALVLLVEPAVCGAPVAPVPEDTGAGASTLPASG